MLYIFAVLPVAVFWGIELATAVSVASMLAFNWFFLPPTHTFQLSDGANWAVLAVYLVTAVVVSALAASARRRAELAELREREGDRACGSRARGRGAAAQRRDSRRRCCTPSRTICGRRSRRSSRLRRASRIREVRLDIADHDELVATIRVEAERLDRLVGNLLDLSRLAGRRGRPRPELWPVDDLVARALEQLGPAASGSSIELDRRPPPVRVDAGPDRARARQPARQRAEVLAAGHAGRRCAWNASDNELCCTSSTRARASPAATSTSSSRSAARASPQGAGLGLAIARGFAEANGAQRLGRRRAVGGGHFVLALPVAAHAPVPA